MKMIRFFRQVQIEAPNLTFCCIWIKLVKQDFVPLFNLSHESCPQEGSSHKRSKISQLSRTSDWLNLTRITLSSDQMWLAVKVRAFISLRLRHYRVLTGTRSVNQTFDHSLMLLWERWPLPPPNTTSEDELQTPWRHSLALFVFGVKNINLGFSKQSAQSINTFLRWRQHPRMCCTLCSTNSFWAASALQSVNNEDMISQCAYRGEKWVPCRPIMLSLW